MNHTTPQSDALRISRRQSTPYRRSGSMNARVLAKIVATADPAWAKARAINLLSEQDQGVFFKVLRDRRAIRNVPRKMPGEADAAYIRRLHVSGWLRQSTDLAAISTN